MAKLERTMSRLLVCTALGMAILGKPGRLLSAPSAEDALLARAQGLASHGHLDMAIQVWQQVLLSDPQSKDALAGIARADMQLGTTQDAQNYLDRLRAAGGTSATIAQIVGMPHVQPPAVRLDQARRLVESGKYEEALRIYRDIYGNEPPAGDAALAYYDTEAAIPANRQDATSGLRRLAQQFPADTRYDIALGRILTYDPKTRGEGMEILKRYPDNSLAQDALHRAEQWNETAPAVSQVSSAPVGNPQEASAYRALNQGHIEEAHRRFQDLLAQHPEDAPALSGMGYVSMKEKDFAAAENYFDQARAAGAKGLDGAISLSRFYQQMAKGDDALQHNNSDAAIEAYRAALQVQPSSGEALEALAGARMQKGDYAEAADQFERSLHAGPNRAASWRGLFLAQSAAGNAQDALATNDRMPAGVRSGLDTDPDYLRALAEDDLALGRKANADTVLTKALALPFPDQGRDMPTDRQMQYAALLMMAKRYEPAMKLYRQVLDSDPESVPAWRAVIAAQHELGRDEEALATIGRIPPAAFNEIQNDSGFLALVGSIYQSQHDWKRAERYLERSLSLVDAPDSSIQIQLADVYAADGRQQDAYAIYHREVANHPDNSAAWRGLLNALHQAGHDREAMHEQASMPEFTRLRLEADPGYLQSLASIQLAVGQNNDALRTFDRLAAVYADQNLPEPVDVQIQLGWALLKTGDDRKLYALASSITGSSELDDSQRSNLNQLLSAWSVRRAETAAASGDHRRSVAILETAARAIPDNVDVLNALAGAYLKAGEAKRAVAIYASLDLTGATLPQYQGAIGAALAAGDMKRASTWIETALDRFPNNAAILKMAADYEQATGNTERAAEYYRAALAALGPETPAGLFSEPGGDGNGGSQQFDSPTRDLMNLLAPKASGTGNTRSTNSGHGASASIDWQDAPLQEVSTLGDFAQSTQEDRLDGWNAAQRSAPDTGIRLESASRNERFSDSGTIDHDAPFDSRTASADANGCCSTVARTAPPVKPRSKSSARSQQNDLSRQAVPTLDSAGRDPDLRQEDTDRTLLGYASASKVSAAPPDVEADDESAAIELENAARLLVTRDVSYRQPLSVTSTRPVTNSESATTGQMTDRDAASTNLEVSSAGQEPELIPGIPINQGNGLKNTAPESNLAAPASEGLPPLTGTKTAAQPLKSPREQINDQLAMINGASSGWFGGSSGVAYRSGQAGYDQLAAYSSEAEASGTLGSMARLTLITEPVLLDSGAATGASTLRQGTLPSTSTPVSESASGLGGELQLRARDFAGSLGTTPRGFLISNVTGGLYVHPPSGHFTLTLSRAPIMDTQLSYAGLRDQGSQGPTYPGNVWGGVITTGGELQVASGDGHSGWYLQGGGQHITGVHVPTNSRFDGDVGAYWGVWHNPEFGNLNVGMNFFGMHYSQNLRYFTYGQGGYFSPDAYVVASIPVSMTGHFQQKFNYRVTASLGLQAFNEESSLFFPLDPALQTAEGNLSYPAQTVVGGNYNFEGEGAYTIADHWYTGGYLNFNNTRDYASSTVGFFVRYLFRPQPLGVESGPTGLFPVHGYRPLRVP